MKYRPLVRIHLLKSHLPICVNKSTVWVICRQIIAFWAHSGEISDPRSHSSTKITFAHLCGIVHSLGHLQSNNRKLDAFCEISDSPSHSSTEIPLAHLCEQVHSLGHLPSNNSILGALWSNIAPRSHSSTEIPLAHLGEVVHSLGHLP